MNELAEGGLVGQPSLQSASNGRPENQEATVDDLRRQSDEAQKTSQAAEICRTLIARSPDRFFLQDRDLRFTWFSHEDIFGISTLGLLGNTHSDLFSPQEVARLEQIKRSVLDGGVGVRAETHLFWNGNEHYFDVFYEPWRDNAGEIAGLAGYVRDITERKQAEKEVRKMTRAVETTPTAVMLADLDGRIEYANPGLLETGGFADANEVLGQSVFDFTNEEGKDKLNEEIIPALNSLGKWRGEFPVKVKSGLFYIAEMICALVKDEYGEPSYYLANFYNITDRKRAEEALLLDEARMEALLLLNQMDEASVQEITDFALQAGVKLTNSLRGYLALLNPGEKTVLMQSWSRNDTSDGKKEGQRVYPWDAPGPWSEALRQKKTIIINQLPSGSRDNPPTEHMESMRSMTVPVFDKGKMVAVVGVGNKEEDYDETDVRQIALLMSGMWKLMQRRKSEEELRRSDRLLQGVAQATNCLLTRDKGAFKKALCILGQATEADRAYIMQNHDSDKGVHLHSQLLEWSKDGVQSPLGDFLVKDVPYRALSPDWYEHLDSGRHVQCLISEVLGPGRTILERLQVRSLLLVPLFLNGRFAASIGFCDCHRDRRWTDIEIGILKAAAGSIGEAMARQRAEEALRESQRILSTLMSNLPGMAYRRKNDPEWTMVFVSDGCLELTGYSPADLVGNRAISYASIIHEDDRDYVWNEVQKALGEKKAFRLTYRINTMSGTKWVWEQGQGIFSASGVLLALEGFISDITERRLAEEALRRTHDELERRVKERTAWLLKANEALHKEMVMHKKTEKELRLAQQAADAASRAKSQFLANMSHEIRTPMNGVIGLAGLLLDTGITSEQRDLVETIRSSGDALSAIINDILDFSKIDEGKMILEDQPFYLQECIETSLNMVAARAAEKDLNMTYLVEDDVPEVLQGDATRLRQVLANLLSNAVKFTEKGSVSLTVSLDESDLIHFAVMDTGIGISEENMSKLFLSFSQVDTSISRKYGGTGLGLAISRRLVELMGGRIWAKSVPFQGSTFHFTIKAIASTVPAPMLQGKRIVARVSNQDSRESLARHAHSWGMQIHFVVSADAARDIDPRNFDVAVVDKEVADAEELIAELQKRLPVITISPSVQRLAGRLSLAKPIKHSQLCAAMQEASRRRELQIATTSLSPASRRDLSILLAEDNAVNQKVALLMLKRLGYRADVAANGLEVLQALKQQPYDVILMDIQMPEMDGLQAARIIRQMPLDKRPQILAMTAYVLQGDKERCLAAGMDGYLGKPVQIEELSRALENIGTGRKE